VSEFKAFVRLAPNDRALLLQAFACLASCMVRLRLQRFAKLQGWATKMGRGAVAVDRLRWAVKVALRLMPSATCLCQALALQRLLARHGHPSELRIGVKKSNSGFSAHAWLVHDGRVLIGGSQSDQYNQLITWDARDDIANSASSLLKNRTMFTIRF
jgi:Transglutaminase-like superfamily